MFTTFIYFILEEKTFHLLTFVSVKIPVEHLKGLYHFSCGKDNAMEEEREKELVKIKVFFLLLKYSLPKDP